MLEMKRRLMLLLSAMVILVTSPATCTGQAPAEVAGVIVGEGAKPLSDAEVTAFPEGRPGVGILPHCFSDGAGHFLITGIPPGRYRISGEKSQGGYGEPRQTLFNSPLASVPMVDLKPGEKAEGVTVRLGPRGGWVEGTVVDADSGAEIRNGSVAVLYARHHFPEMYGAWSVGRGRRFRVLLPSDKKVRLKFSARGYDSWYLGTDGTEAHAAAVRLKPGEVKRIEVRLRPLPQKKE